MATAFFYKETEHQINMMLRDEKAVNVVEVSLVAGIQYRQAFLRYIPGSPATAAETVVKVFPKEYGGLCNHKLHGQALKPHCLLFTV